jgi:surface polysaccharide O-acyltransferase-like enzyme
MINVKRDITLDALRAFALFLIILVHATGPGFYLFATPQWRINVAYASIARAGVPLFFMVSGAVLLSRTHDVASILRRIWKIAVPLIVWSLIYLYIDHYRGIEHANWARFILSTSAAPHLWFLYAMIGAYLALPAMAAFHQAVSMQNRVLFLSAWFVLTSVVPLSSFWLGQWLLIDGTFFPMYGGYFLLGASLCMLKPSLLLKWIGLAAACAGALATYVLTVRYSIKAGSGIQQFFGYWQPSVAISAAGIFIFFRCIKQPTRAVVRGVQFIATTSFGVYLMHWAVLLFVQLRYGSVIVNHSIWAPLTLAVVVIVVCSPIVWIAHRIPYLRAVMPK